MSSNHVNSIKIAVVGDIHDLWEAEDAEALHYLGVHLVLFVGDFGNEAVDVVRKIASLEIPKAAIMGNHDAWYTASDWGRKKAPYDHSKEDRVQQQLDWLGDAHVGYTNRDFPELNLSVVGSRPFSWGGMKWKNKEFYRDRYGINNFEESTARITAATRQAAHDTVIFIGHNGPHGLGDNPEDPCGKDWQPLGGDYGDPDLTEALAQVRTWGRNIPLVTFGHMHHRLRHTSKLRTAVNEQDGTLYLNAASVPRIVEIDGERLRNFSIVSLEAGVVSEACLVWLGTGHAITSKQVFYRRESVASASELPLAGRVSTSRGCNTLYQK